MWFHKPNQSINITFLWQKKKIDFFQLNFKRWKNQCRFYNVDNAQNTYVQFLPQWMYNTFASCVMFTQGLVFINNVSKFFHSWSTIMSLYKLCLDNWISTLRSCSSISLASNISSCTLLACSSMYCKYFSKQWEQMFSFICIGNFPYPKEYILKWNKFTKI